MPCYIEENGDLEIIYAVAWLGGYWPAPLREVLARSQVSPCGIYGRKSGNWTCLSPSTSVFPCQYHSTDAPLLSITDVVYALAIESVVK